jgi:bacterioferritin
MKGHARIIERLNDLLADELTAINQYIVQSEMCANWGYEKLHKAIEKQAIDEMKHAENRADPVPGGRAQRDPAEGHQRRDGHPEHPPE